MDWNLIIGAVVALIPTLLVIFKVQGPKVKKAEQYAASAASYAASLEGLLQEIKLAAEDGIIDTNEAGKIALRIKNTIDLFMSTNAGAK